MVLRQLPPEGGTQEQGKRIIESVDLARQAVQLDVSDGTSWCKFVSINGLKNYGHLPYTYNFALLHIHTQTISLYF